MEIIESTLKSLYPELYNEIKDGKINVRLDDKEINQWITLTNKCIYNAIRINKAFIFLIKLIFFFKKYSSYF